jgi:uncharacterized protein YcnI
MKIIAASLTLASLLAASAAHADRSQLIAHLKLTPEQAATMSLSEIAALKFNSDSDGDNQQSVTAAIPVGVKTFLPIRQEGDEH